MPGIGRSCCWRARLQPMHRRVPTSSRPVPSEPLFLAPVSCAAHLPLALSMRPHAGSTTRRVYINKAAAPDKTSPKGGSSPSPSSKAAASPPNAHSPASSRSGSDNGAKGSGARNKPPAVTVELSKDGDSDYDIVEVRAAFVTVCQRCSQGGGFPTRLMTCTIARACTYI